MPKQKTNSRKAKPKKSSNGNGIVKSRVICATPKCRKSALDGSAYCGRCLKDQDGMESVIKLEEIEALQFARMDTELRNCLQGKELNRLRLQALESDYRNKLKALETEYTAKKTAIAEDFANLERTLQRMRPIYVTFVKEVAAKYGFPADTQITIDPDTRVIRDLGAAEKKVDSGFPAGV